MHPLNQVPELKVELNRKTIEAIEWLVVLRTTGQLTDAQYHTGIDTLWKTVNGLVSESIKDVLEQAEHTTFEQPAGAQQADANEARWGQF